MTEQPFNAADLKLRHSATGPTITIGYGNPPCPPPNPRTEIVDGMRVLRDVTVTMRDGLGLYTDVYLPADASLDGTLGVIVGWAAFGKHSLTNRLPEAMGVSPDQISRHTGWEMPDPAYWTQHGYAVVYPDPRGTWNNQGTYFMFGDGEINDVYDLTEWAGTQSWSNGKVGYIGVSYPGVVCWEIAGRRPPHLAAIVPWEAWSDIYREFCYHGGIRETGHTKLVDAVMRWPGLVGEDLGANFDAHPFDDAFHRSKNPDLEAIEVPVLACASWSDQGLHTRGTIEGWRRAGSQQKWLLVHGRKKWGEYYNPVYVELQRAFFDRFLLGKADAFQNQPPVRIEVRERAMVGTLRNEKEWPLARTEWRALHLDAARRTMSRTPVAGSTTASYDPLGDEALTFDIRFDEDTELSGPMKLKLWVQAEGSDDMDLFVALQKLDAQGALVGFPFFATHIDGPVALGWLRASHRELDPARSTPGAPVHLHQREQRLAPGEVVPVEIAIWPSSTLFRRGESLRVRIQGKDIYVYDDPAQNRHLELRNAGRHIVHCGGAHDSHLLVPFIPTQAA